MAGWMDLSLPPTPSRCGGSPRLAGAQGRPATAPRSGSAIGPPLRPGGPAATGGATHSARSRLGSTHSPAGSAATIKALGELPGAQDRASLEECPLPRQVEVAAHSRDALTVLVAECRSEHPRRIVMRRRRQAWEACGFPRSSLKPHETLSTPIPGSIKFQRLILLPCEEGEPVRITTAADGQPRYESSQTLGKPPCQALSGPRRNSAGPLPNPPSSNLTSMLGWKYA